MAKKIAAGNWKMNGLTRDLGEAEAIASAAEGVSVVLCPPATLVAKMAAALTGLPVAIGGQDCHGNACGAHTGDISADMLVDAGASHVILGHSERRSDHGETNAQVAAKVKAAWSGGLTAILCLGETLDERDGGTTLDIISTQLAQSLPDGGNADNTIIAYEPVWAIGTGRTASPDEISEVHAFLRDELSDRIGADAAATISLLYGGSVKAANAAEIFAVADVDGALVGGASLTAKDFVPIIQALAAS